MTEDKKLLELGRRIEIVEETYEYFLSYAARGSDGISEGQSESGVRAKLQSAADAMQGMAHAARELTQNDRSFELWIDILAEDEIKASAGLNLVLSQPVISSQLIDNLNASIHLRTVLTDLFVLDEAAKAAGYIVEKPSPIDDN